MDVPTCNENDTAFSRGRIPAHDVPSVYSMICVSMSAKRRVQLRKILMVKSNNYQGMCSRRHKEQSEKLLCDTIFYYYYSCDKNNQPVLSLSIPIEDPIREYSSFDFYNFTGFWPAQFDEIVREITLLPRIIVYHRSCSTSSLEIALFILLR